MTAHTAIAILGLLLFVLISIITVLLGVLVRAQRAAEAGEKLYRATRWRSTTPRLSEHVEAEMWQEFRDALLIEPGTATALGVGDPKA